MYWAGTFIFGAANPQIFKSISKEYLLVLYLYSQFQKSISSFSSSVSHFFPETNPFFEIWFSSKPKYLRSDQLWEAIMTFRMAVVEFWKFRKRGDFIKEGKDLVSILRARVSTASCLTFPNLTQILFVSDLVVGCFWNQFLGGAWCMRSDHLSKAIMSCRKGIGVLSGSRAPVKSSSHIIWMDSDGFRRRPVGISC